MAQVVRKAEGAHKMVKNSKGLWVKQTDTGSTAVGGGGRGRGSGIPVFKSTSSSGNEEQSIPKTYDQRNHYQFEDNEDDTDPRAGQQSSRTLRHRSYSRERSRSRDRDRKRDRDRDRDMDRFRDAGCRDHRDGRRDRDRSRSPDRYRSGEKSDRRQDSYRETGRHGDHVSRKRDRNQYDDSNRDRKSRGESDDRDRERDRDRDRRRERERSRSPDYRRDADKGRNDDDDDEDGRVPDDSPDGEATPIHVTAIQVVNRFHEVYSTDTLFAKDRIASLCELLAPSSSIRSLKTDAEYLAGPAAIGESFNKTLAAPVSVSKRVYIEPTEEQGSVSYVVDLHRAGTAPGLGDKAKDTVLLYRVKDAEILSIWGTADSEKLAADADLSKERLLTSKAWKMVSQIISKERSSVDEAGLHYHNYDRMEVWG
jgi:hypothetical protein